jgi:hypothetical protein
MNRFIALTVACLAISTGCKDKDEEQPKLETKAGDGGIAAQARAVDRGLAKAVEKVDQGRAGVGPTAEGGPPERGIFEAGQADRELPPGQAAKVTVGSSGQPPRVRLGGIPKPATTQKATLGLKLQLGQGGGLPPLRCKLTLKTRAPKPVLSAPPGSSPTESPSAGVEVVATVDAVSVNARGLQVPEALAREVAKLKGSSVSFHMGPRGETSDFTFDVAGAAGPTWRSAVQSLSTVLGQALVPFPEQPLGAGGYFLAVTRSQVAGVAVLSYRMLKVEQVTNGVASLSVTGRHYAADRTFSAPDLAEGKPLELDQFALQSEGRMQIAAGQTFPATSETSLRLSALLIPPDATDQLQQGPLGPQRQRLGLQAQVKSTWSADGVDRPLGPEPELLPKSAP